MKFGSFVAHERTASRAHGGYHGRSERRWIPMKHSPQRHPPNRRFLLQPIICSWWHGIPSSLAMSSFTVGNSRVTRRGMTEKKRDSNTSVPWPQAGQVSTMKADSTEVNPTE